MRNAGPLETGENFTQVHIFQKPESYIKVYTKIRNPRKIGSDDDRRRRRQSVRCSLGEDGLIRKRVENRLIHTHKLNCDVRASRPRRRREACGIFNTRSV